MTKAVAAITLDLDDTLWDATPAIASAETRLREWMEQHVPAVAAAFPPPVFAQLRRDVAAEMPHIAHDFTALRHEALTRMLGAHGADKALADTCMDVFITARSEVELFPDVPEALERLASRYPLVALTNGNADIRRAGIGHFFSCTVNARSAGAAKPDARIFQSGCTHLKVDAAEVLHVGDHPEFDVRGARRAGLQAAWMNRQRLPWTGEPEAFIEVHDMRELCEALGV